MQKAKGIGGLVMRRILQIMGLKSTFAFEELHNEIS